MIPQGIAVRDAHACYEVVVLVTVPDEPRSAPCCLYDIWQLRGCLSTRGVGTLVPSSRALKLPPRVLLFFGAEEKIDKYDGRKSH